MGLHQRCSHGKSTIWLNAYRLMIRRRNYTDPDGRIKWLFGSRDTINRCWVELNRDLGVNPTHIKLWNYSEIVFIQNVPDLAHLPVSSPFKPEPA